MMKVLMLGPALKVHGGISEAVNNLIKAGLSDKVELDYIATMEEGSKAHKLIVAIKAYMKFAKDVKAFDIIHVNMASDSSYIRKSFFINKAYKEKKKIIIHQHGGDIINYYSGLDVRKKERMQSTFKKADLIIALSERSKEFLRTLTGEDADIRVLPNSINIPEDVDINNKSYGSKKILFLGRICKDKGINELLEAMDQLHNEDDEIKLSIGGIYEDLGFKTLIEARKSYIDYLGWIEGSKKDEVLRAHDILVLPSYYEGLPVCILDAMAYGLGVVSTDVGGIGEVIEDKVSGILIKPKDVNALKQGLELLIKDKEYIRKLALNGRKKAEDGFSSSRAVSKLVEIYKII